MSRDIVRSRSRDPIIMTPEQFEQNSTPGQMVIVQPVPKPWGWIVAIIAICGFFLFSFFSWLVQMVLAHLDKAEQRAHELSLRALETAERTRPESVDFGTMFSNPDFLLPAGMVFIAVVLAAKSLK